MVKVMMYHFLINQKLINLSINMMRAKSNERCVANIVPASIIPDYYNMRKNKKQDYLAAVFKQKYNDRES